MLDLATLDIETLTIGECEDIEEHAGIDLFELSELIDQGRLRPRHLKVLLWIVRRRDEPTVTLEQMRDVRIADVMPRRQPADRKRPAAGARTRRPPA